MNIFCFIFFFFSSRRRHTRCSRDWSSDVCSSDLVHKDNPIAGLTLQQVDAIFSKTRKGGHPTDIKTWGDLGRSEEHTSELQSRLHLVCRLLLEKKKKNNKTHINQTIILYIVRGIT